MTGEHLAIKSLPKTFKSAVIDMDGALTASECLHFRFY